MEHNTSQNSKTQKTFSTSNILAAFERAQADFVGDLPDMSSLSLSPNQEATTAIKKKIVRTPDAFKFLSNAMRDQGTKQTKDATTTARFNDSLLKKQRIEITYENPKAQKASTSSLSSCIRTFPEFPWAVTSTEVVVTPEVEKIFHMTNDEGLITLKHEDSTIETPDLVGLGAVDYAIKECNNWHRSSLLTTAGTSYIMTYQGNAIKHEPQAALFANPLLAQAFGFFCGPDKKLFSPEEKPEIEDVRPDGVMGFFSVKTPEPDQYAVVSILPNSDDLCLCLQLLLKLGVCLGTNEVLLPVCVTEYKATNNLNDLSKLAYEMDRLRLIHNTIWKVPPKVHYGIYVDGSTWYIRAIGEGSPRTVRTVWTQSITNIYEAIYVAAVVYRFAAYLLERTSKLEPDFDRLKSWITRLAKEKVSGETLETILEALDSIGKPETDQSESDQDDGDTYSKDESPSEDSSHVIKFLDALAGHGFNGIKLLKDHGETKIYACRKGNGKGVIKIGPWNRIEREANALHRLRGPGVERLLTFSRIENSQFGSMVLERLYPLPKHIKTTRELQDITKEIMRALVRIHGKNYLHRDIKRSNIMMDSYKNVKLIDFECAMKEDAEDFDIFYGTNFYKPIELYNSHTPYGITPRRMRAAKLHGSVEADSYSAALVCASLMYDIDIEADAEGEQENIETLHKWLEERKIAHVATSSAVDLFCWMLVDDPAIRFSAAQALKHPFITEYIPLNPPKEQPDLSKESSSIQTKNASVPVNDVAKNLQSKPGLQSSFVDKENLSPNVVRQH